MYSYTPKREILLIKNEKLLILISLGCKLSIIKSSFVLPHQNLLPVTLPGNMCPHIVLLGRHYLCIDLGNILEVFDGIMISNIIFCSAWMDWRHSEYDQSWWNTPGRCWPLGQRSGSYYLIHHRILHKYHRGVILTIRIIDQNVYWDWDLLYWDSIYLIARFPGDYGRHVRFHHCKCILPTDSDKIF